MGLLGRVGWLVAATVLAVGAGCTSHIGLQPQLGQKVSPTRIVVGPVFEGRFDYLVHLSGDRKLDDRAYRLDQARKEMADRCTVTDLVDLYAHQVGTWRDGSARLSYAIGIHCAK